MPLQMDFSVPPPNLPSTNFQSTFPTDHRFQTPANPWIRPEAISATFGGPSYQLFSGNSPVWSLQTQNSSERPPNLQLRTPLQPNPQTSAAYQNVARPQMNRQNFLFQPGPSPLEKLLQQNPKKE